MTKAQIKSTGKIVEVTSRFMPKKRGAPSREWMCNLSDGTCINESELEYIKDSLQDELDKEASEYADKHYSEWEEYWDDYNGYNAEPENDKLQLIDAFKAGVKWQQEHPKIDLEKEIKNYLATECAEDDEPSVSEIAHHFYELGQIEMRHRITNPEYNAKVVEQLKSEYPARKED